MRNSIPQLLQMPSQPDPHTLRVRDELLCVAWGGLAVSKQWMPEFAVAQRSGQKGDWEVRLTPSGFLSPLQVPLYAFRAHTTRVRCRWLRQEDLWVMHPCWSTWCTPLQWLCRQVALLQLCTDTSSAIVLQPFGVGIQPISTSNASQLGSTSVWLGLHTSVRCIPPGQIRALLSPALPVSLHMLTLVPSTHAPLCRQHLATWSQT